MKSFFNCPFSTFLAYIVSFLSVVIAIIWVIWDKKKGDDR